MSAPGIVYAFITVMAWGTWLAPSQNVPMKGQQTRTFFVTLAVMVMALMLIIGTGRGFTIAQLCVVVNALVGVYILKEPNPRTKAARLTLIGVIIAMAGAIVLGNIK